MNGEPLRATFTVEIETREGGDYYFDHDDLVANVIPWIEEGLSDRDDLTQVSVTARAPLTLAQEIEQALANQQRSGCHCSKDCPDEPCTCGHAYHGHNHGLDPVIGGGRCLNCDCIKYRPTENYPRCGAWGGCPLPMGHNKGRADLPENHRSPKVELTEPDHPAAHALAQYIASHSASTVMAACRYLGWKLDFELTANGNSRPETSFECVQCEDSGACNGGPCPIHSETSLARCSTCQGTIGWIDSPTGGWWSHERHPHDGHVADPAPSGCPAGLLPQGSGAAQLCVVQDPQDPDMSHRLHRTATGEAWVPGEPV